jgi:hypothetical protein
MTHITISDRIIAVEVEKGSKDFIVSNGQFGAYKSIYYWHDGQYKNVRLGFDNAYKFLCLASDIVLAHHAIKLTVDEIVDTCDKLDKDKEYVLIEVE